MQRGSDAWRNYLLNAINALGLLQICVGKRFIVALERATARPKKFGDEYAIRWITTCGFLRRSRRPAVDLDSPPIACCVICAPEGAP